MTNEERNNGIALIKDQKFNEAYTYYNDLYEKSKDDEALYLRALIDFSYLKEHLEETTKAFKSLADGNSKFKLPCLHLCTLIYNMQGDVNSSIHYGEEALSDANAKIIAPEFKQEILQAMASNYFTLGGKQELEKALNYINQAIELDDGSNKSLYIIKIDILISLESFDDAEDMLYKFQTKFGASGAFYLVKERLAFAKGSKIKEKDGLTDEAKQLFYDALDLLDICSKYDENTNIINNNKSEIYTALGEFDKAIAAIDAIATKDNEIGILIEKLKIAEACDKHQQALDFCYDYLKNHNTADDWMVEYSLALTIFKDATTKEELLEAKKYYVKAYNTSKELYILYELYFVNNSLGCFQENFDLVKEAYDNQEDTDGRLAYYYATMAQILECPYDFINKLLNEAVQKGYLEVNEFLDEVTSICENPKEYYKPIKYLTKAKLEDPWSLRKMGIRYLYGEDGIKVNYKKAEECFMLANEKAKRTCIKTITGRFYEVAKKDYDKAFAYYKEAYEMYQKDPFPSCYCPVAYMSYALYFGIGTEKDEEKALEMLSDIINKYGKLNSNIAIYYYTYFALKEIPNFSLEKAFECLKSIYPFYRYEITRFVYLDRVCKKLNIPINKEEYDDIIAKTLIYGTKGSKKYYKETLNDPIPLPFELNY